MGDSTAPLLETIGSIRVKITGKERFKQGFWSFWTAARRVYGYISAANILLLATGGPAFVFKFLTPANTTLGPMTPSVFTNPVGVWVFVAFTVANAIIQMALRPYQQKRARKFKQVNADMSLLDETVKRLLEFKAVLEKENSNLQRLVDRQELAAREGMSSVAVLLAQDQEALRHKVAAHLLKRENHAKMKTFNHEAEQVADIVNKKTIPNAQQYFDKPGNKFLWWFLFALTTLTMTASAWGMPMFILLTINAVVQAVPILGIVFAAVSIASALALFKGIDEMITLVKARKAEKATVKTLQTKHDEVKGLLSTVNNQFEQNNSLRIAINGEDLQGTLDLQPLPGNAEHDYADNKMLSDRIVQDDKRVRSKIKRANIPGDVEMQGGIFGATIAENFTVSSPGALK